MSKSPLKNLISFVQDKGFVYGPSPEIYGGLAGFYTYGPLGKLLKNNVEQAIRDVFQKNEFFEVECPTIMHDKVWEASGHLGGFTDPLIQCEKCEGTFRVDTLIEEKLPNLTFDPSKHDQLLKIIKNNRLGCPNCKGLFKYEIKNHSLMMGTTIGANTPAHNRPETATTTYLPFLRYKEFFREKFPFGVFQIGKAFRNEISPRQHALRMREFTQAEGQLFLFEEQKNNFEKFEKIKDEKLPLWIWQDQKAGNPPKLMSLKEARNNKNLNNDAYAWTLHLTYNLFIKMGIPKDKIRFRQHFPDEKAFYADDAWDLEVHLNSFGWFEMAGVHDRSNYDLKQHSKFSGKDLIARDENNQKQTPHILEIAFGTDRPTFALLDLFYDKKEKDEGKTTFNIPYKLAPLKFAVFPLINKLQDDARELYNTLREEFQCVFDKSGAIGRRYLRADNIGIPFCITYDFESKDNNTVTIRDRNSQKQIRVNIDELKTKLNNLLSGKEIIE